MTGRAPSHLTLPAVSHYLPAAACAKLTASNLGEGT